MSNLDRRGGYTPRRAREQRAYRLVVSGTVAGGIGVIPSQCGSSANTSGAADSSNRNSRSGTSPFSSRSTGRR